MTIELSTTAFQDGDGIPKEYTGDGRNASPPMEWSEPPQGTKRFALICEDPDAPRGTFTHWVVFNLPAETRKLAAGMPMEATLPDGTAQGKNDFGKIGYGGPAPPPGKPHRYVFILYALDQALDLKPGASRAQLLAAMKGRVLAEGRRTGTYQR